MPVISVQHRCGHQARHKVADNMELDATDAEYDAIEAAIA